MTNILKYLEFLVSEMDEISSKPSSETEVPIDGSFFHSMEALSSDCISLSELLDGRENFLAVLSDEWSEQNLSECQFPIAIDTFLKENHEELERPEMKVRTILDYVYTVV